jgi:hypothetical protein
LNVVAFVDFFGCLFSGLRCLSQLLQELYHVLGIYVKDVLHELVLKSLTVLIDVFGKVKSELVDDWHASLEHVEDLLSIFEQALAPINTLHPFEQV